MHKESTSTSPVGYIMWLCALKDPDGISSTNTVLNIKPAPFDPAASNLNKTTNVDNDESIESIIQREDVALLDETEKLLSESAKFLLKKKKKMTQKAMIFIDL